MSVEYSEAYLAACAKFKEPFSLVAVNNGVNICPYLTGTQAHADWHMGWEDCVAYRLGKEAVFKSGQPLNPYASSDRRHNIFWEGVNHPRPGD